MDPMLKAVLSNYAIQLPIILVWAAGLVIALVRWKEHPRVSVLALIAFSVLMLQLLIDTYLNVWMPRWLYETRGSSNNEVANFLLVKGVVSNLIRMGLWGLVIIALFGWRAKSGPRCSRCRTSLKLEVSTAVPSGLPRCYLGSVCKSCGRIECYNCRGGVGLPCSSCAGEVLPAYEHLFK